VRADEACSAEGPARGDFRDRRQRWRPEQRAAPDDGFVAQGDCVDRRQRWRPERGAAADDGFVSVALAITLGLIFASFLYLFHGAIYMRAGHELQRAADSLALAAAGALRENGLRARGEIDVELDLLVRDAAQPNLTVARITEYDVSVIDAPDEHNHESIVVELKGELSSTLAFFGFTYGAPPFSDVTAQAHIMRWVLTAERLPIVLVLADASDRMGDKAPDGGEESHWWYLRQAIMQYAQSKFPARFGLVAFRDPRSMDERNATVGKGQGGDSWFLENLGIPEYRWPFPGATYDEEAGEALTKDDLTEFEEYMKDDLAYEEEQDGVRVLPTAEPQLDNWLAVQELLQEQILLNPGGHTNLGNALARAKHLIEINDAQQVDRTVLLLSNDRPFIPFDPDLPNAQCSETWFGEGTRCQQIPEPEEVRQAFIERAAELRQVEELGATLATIKLRNRTYEEMVCDLFNRLCGVGWAFAQKVKQLNQAIGKAVEGAVKEGLCGGEDSASAGAGAAESPEAGPTADPTGGSPAGSGAPKVACEEREEGWGKSFYQTVVKATGTIMTTVSGVKALLEQFSGALRVPYALATYVLTRVGTTGKAEEEVEEWIKPLSGGPFDEEGDDPRYHAQVNTPSEVERIVMAMAHYGCVYDPLVPHRKRSGEDDPGQIEPGEQRSWIPFAFIRDGNQAERPLPFLEEEQAESEQIVDEQPWNADYGLASEQQGYRLLADRLLAVRLTMKSCSELGLDARNRLVLRWGPPRMGMGPEFEIVRE
jgi:hypothetical protein